MEDDLPGAIRRMEERIRSEAEPEEGSLLWTATAVLMGLRCILNLPASRFPDVHKG